jgi:hypothetical protein
MLYLLDAILIVILLVILVQDVKSKEISVILFPMVLGLLVVKAFAGNGMQEVLNNSMVNASILAIQFSMLFLYFMMKHGKFVNIFSNKIGLGDLLILLVLCPAFTPMNFIVFMVSGLAAIAIFYLIKNKISHSTVEHIPLAGNLALLYVLVIVIGMVVPELKPQVDWLVI